MRWGNTAAACAALLASAAASAWPSLPLPPDAQYQVVSDDVRYNGFTMQTAIMTSPHPPDEIIDFYRQRWGESAQVNQFSNYLVVGHLDRDVYVTVQVKDSDGHSLAEVGMMNLKTRDAHFVKGKGFPVPSGAVVASDISDLDVSPRSRTVNMSTSLSPEQCKDFYARELPGMGWKAYAQATCSADRSSCVGQFEKGSAHLQLAIGREATHTFIVLNQVGE